MARIRPSVAACSALAASGALIATAGEVRHEWRSRLRRVAVSVAEHENYWRWRATHSGEILLVVLGDSLAQGIGADHPERGFLGRFTECGERALGATIRVLNLARTGAGIADVLHEQLPTLDRFQPDLVIVEIGTNDVGRRDTAEFAADFAYLCERLPAGSLVGDVPDFKRGPQRAAARSLCGATRRILDRHPELVPVDMHSASAAMHWWEFAADLAHPGNSGHRRYADAFWDAYRASRSR